MMFPGKASIAAGLALLLAGCATPVKTVEVDPARLMTPAKVALACDYRLGEVVDGRPEAVKVSKLGANRLTLADPVLLVRNSLMASGFEPAGPDAGSAIDVELVQMYVLPNHVTKVPVVVYRVRQQGKEPWLVRAQPASMLWSGSEDEAVAAYRVALAEANAQLVSRLNKGCTNRANTHSP